MKRPSRPLLIIIGIVIVALIASQVFHKGDAALPDLQTAAVVRGDVLAGISATGTLEPEEVVDIGAQVTGCLLYTSPSPRDS